MIKRLGGLLLCLAMAMAAGIAHGESDARQVRVQQVDGWTLKTMATTSTGEFEVCGISRKRDDVELVFMLERAGNLGMAVSKPSWRLARADRAVVVIDDGPQRVLTQVAAGGRNILVGLGKEADFVADLRRGRALRFVSQPGIRISLAGVARALDALKECGHDNGVAWPGLAYGEAKPARSRAEEMAYALGWFDTRIFPEIPGIRYVDPDRAKTLKARGVSIQSWWVGQRALGTLAVIEPGDLSFEEIEQAVGGVVRRLCTGQFMPGKTKRTGQFSWSIARCDDAYDFTLLFTSAAGFVYALQHKPLLEAELTPTSEAFMQAIQDNWP